MIPARLPNPTRKPVRAALEDSDRSLLLCLQQSQRHATKSRTLYSPRMHQDRGDVCARCHQEASKVRHTLVLQSIDTRQNNHSDERYRQRPDDMESTLSEVVRRLCKAQQNNKAGAVGRNSPKVCLDGGVPQPLDDLWKEVAGGRECDRVGESDHSPVQEAPAIPAGERFLEI